MPVRTALGGARMRRVAATALLVGAAAGSLGLPTPAAAAASSPALDPQERAVCKQINAFRAANGVGRLRLSVPLTRAAKWMSSDMAANDTFDHVDSRGRDFDERIPKFGYRGMTMAENLVAGEPEAAATFTQLRQSSEHRRNMLRAKLKTIGVGRAHRAGSMYEWYWTTTFGVGNDRGVAC